MKLFIDSARLDEIEQAYSYGILDGVTTNPSLIKKAVDNLKKQGKKVDMKEYIKQILKTAKGTPVSLEVTETSYECMVSQGKKLFKMFNPVAKNVYIKIPVNPSFTEEASTEGIRAIKILTKAGIPVNCTLIFTPEQALLAAKAGAAFVSPFAGRVDDYLRKNKKIKFEKHDYFPAHGMKNLEDNGIVSGIDLIEQIRIMFDNYGIRSKVLAASLRNTRQVRESALVGADIATLPFSVIKKLLTHYKSQEGMKNFTKDIVPEYVKLTR